MCNKKDGNSVPVHICGHNPKNGRIKRKFATLYYGRVRSMFIATGLEGSLRKKLWAKAMNTAVDLNNIIVNQHDVKTLYKIISGENVAKIFNQPLTC